MTAMAILPRRRPDDLGRPPLDRLLCAVDGSRGSAEAVREALALAPCSTRLCFIAVADVAAEGCERVASLAAHRARQTLEQAQALACARAQPAETQLVEAADVVATLIDRAGSSALLVVGSHGERRPGDTAPGSVAAALAGQAGGPLLVARARAGAGAEGTRPRILVALDDSPAASALVGLAGSIAAGCRGYVHLVHVQGPGYGSQTRHRLAELSTELIEQTGSEPVVEVARGANVAAHICQLARDSDSSLVVVGRRGPRTLGRVGGPIVHGAPCSVLVVPTTDT